MNPLGQDPEQVFDPNAGLPVARLADPDDRDLELELELELDDDLIDFDVDEHLAMDVDMDMGMDRPLEMDVAIEIPRNDLVDVRDVAVQRANIVDQRENVPRDQPDAVVAEVVVRPRHDDNDNPHWNRNRIFNRFRSRNGIVRRWTNLRGRHADAVSSYLYNVIQEGPTCSAVLGGSSRRPEGSCAHVVGHCNTHRDQAHWIGFYGRTPLHEACFRGSCCHIIRALLEANSVGATKRDYRGNTPLHLLFAGANTYNFCPHHGIESIMDELLAVCPVPLPATHNLEGNTPLHMACAAPERIVPHDCLAKLVLANPEMVPMVNSAGKTPLRLHCERRSATVDVARILYEANPKTISLLDREGWGPLHSAAANKNSELIQYLVKANPDAARHKTSKGETALHILCRQTLEESHLSSIDTLLQAYPDATTEQDIEHLYTPLHLICLSGLRAPVSVVTRLLQDSSQAAQLADTELYLPLHHACENGCQASIVSALVQCYPSAAKSMTRKQDSALSLACTHNKSTETVQILIEANPDALVKKNDYGFTPLHCVCRAYQPRVGIVKALLEACPSCVTFKTHGGETPVHLVCNNSGAFVGVLQLLTAAHNNFWQKQGSHDQLLPLETKSTTNKVGNTPLHDACFRGAPFEHVETLAVANPQWVLVRNNAGYLPFQILCKNGRIDERIVSTFSRIGGPEIFSIIDTNGNTPLHSAMRPDMDLGTLKCLIRAFPDALHLKTIYGDSPLHLACFRQAQTSIVLEVALASSNGHVSPILEPNSAGQNPISIAIEEYRSLCCGGRCCCVASHYQPDLIRVFENLATLVKILYYGPNHQDYGQLSLVQACVAIHRQDVRLDPSFIRRALEIYPDEARIMDNDGNYPLHIEASIPVEKMFLLDGNTGCSSTENHKRIGLLRVLLELFPGATQVRNKNGHFPLTLMVQNGRLWGHELALVLGFFPPALYYHKGLDDSIMAFVLERASKECGIDTLFSLLNSRPDICRRRSADNIE